MEALKENNPSSRTWTNEKHISYIKRMEANFVRAMFANDGRRKMASHHAPLDRYLPDSSDSTRDLKRQRHIRTTATATIITTTTTTTTTTKEGMGTNYTNAGKPDEKKMKRRKASRPLDSIQDQVVPEIGNGTTDKDDDNLEA